MLYFKSDLHLHSISSGHAFNTIDEITHFAMTRGYDLIGISDHGPNMEGAPHSGYFEMLHRLPKTEGNIRILYGCEANILNTSGKLDISNELNASLDYVIAGLHKRTSYSGCTKSEHTTAIVSAIRSGYVDIISHPISPSFSVDIHEVVKAAAEYNVILEANKTVLINAVSLYHQDIMKAYDSLFCESQKRGVYLLFGSDAHHVSEMGLLPKELQLLQNNYRLDLDNLINQQCELLLEFLKNRKAQKRML